MARASSPPGLRPFLPADAATLAALFRASVETLAAEDYSDDQRAAWASLADDEAAFGARLAAELTIVALVDHKVAGFAALKDNVGFDMLYVAPEMSRRGVGAALADAVEKLATARGTTTLTAQVSDAARDFFTARGYVGQSRNTREVNGHWLGNTTMTKQLTPSVERAH